LTAATASVANFFMLSLSYSTFSHTYASGTHKLFLVSVAPSSGTEQVIGEQFFTLYRNSAVSLLIPEVQVIIAPRVQVHAIYKKDFFYRGEQEIWMAAEALFDPAFREGLASMFIHEVYHAAHDIGVPRSS
jgi:hypothetical protein